MPSGQISERRRDWVAESRGRVIQLSAAEQAELEWLGRRLATGRDRFGEAVPDSEASLIRCLRVDESHCRVQATSVVGVLATKTLELRVVPKIAASHLLFLLERADYLPAFSPGDAHLEPDASLFELLAQWFITSLERVLEEGLARGYEVMRDDVPAMRGRVLPVETALLYYRGRLSISAEFEEFDFNTPLNRLLNEAARAIVRSPALSEDVRRRAIRARKRMDGVGNFRPGDLRARVDRQTSYYSGAAMLAKRILEGRGTTLEGGSAEVWSFLIPTPGPVERGIRAILKSGLGGLASVRKPVIHLPDSTVTFNPDLVFDEGLCVADVKYKVGGDDWLRNDLYEVIAFAEAVGTGHGAIINFRDEPGHLAPLTVGAKTVRELCWRIKPGHPPEASAAALIEDVAQWIAGIQASEGLADKQGVVRHRSGASPARPSIRG
jgi:5-methylcytosine-specific restriction enzyme subunit McrC